MPDQPFQIDRYRILHEIGSGGMATVYAAIQPRPRRTVALKVLKNEAASDSAVRRFKREAEILARLRHPSIAQVYDAGTYEIAGKTRPFFVMEYIPGAKTILEYVAQKQFHRRDRLKLFVSVCRAVEYGHRHRVLHRDLKPANILIDQSGQLKIIDFGVASAPDLKVAGATMNTEAGVLVGTIQYMSPEQVSLHPQDLDPRSDVYSLGVLLYKLMTGQFPHDVDGLPIYEAIRMIREDEPVRPSERDPELKGDVETIILRAVAKDAAQRYQSAGALAADIVQFLNRQPIQAKPPKPARNKSGSRALLGALAVVLLLAIGAGGWLWTQRDRSETITNTSSTGAMPEPTERASDSPSNELTGGFARPAPKSNVTILDAQDGRITALAVDAAGKRIVSGAHDNSIVIWDVTTKKPLLTFHEHESPPISIQFTRDETRCLSLDESGRLFEWNASDGRIVNEKLSPGGPAHGLAMDSNSDRVALACDDGTVRIGAFAQNRWIAARGSTGAFHSAAFSADGVMVLGGSARGDVYIWKSTNGERAHRLSGLDSPIAFVTLNADTSLVVAIAQNGDGMIWDYPPPSDDDARVTRGRRFDACEGTVVSTTVSASGRWLIAASADSLRVWETSSFRPGQSVFGETARLTTRIYSVTIDDEAQIVVVGTDGGEVHMHAMNDLVQPKKE